MYHSIKRMDSLKNCSLNYSSEFFVAYNLTTHFSQRFAIWNTWLNVIICFCAIIINFALVIRLPKLIRTGQIAFKRYALVFNLSVSDIVGCSVIGIFSVVQIHSGQTLFGDFLHAKFGGIKIGIPLIIAVSYAAQIIYTVFP